MSDNLQNKITLAEIASHTSSKEFYTRHVSSRLSVFVSYVFIKVGLRNPNIITLLMGAPAVAFLIFVMLGGEPFAVIGFVGLVMINVFDTSDGEVARFLKTTSEAGDYLDRAMHVFVAICIYGAMAQYITNVWDFSLIYPVIMVLLALTVSAELWRDLHAIQIALNKKVSRKDVKRSTHQDGQFVQFIKHSLVLNGFMHIAPVIVLVGWLFNWQGAPVLVSIYFLLSAVLIAFAASARALSEFQNASSGPK